MSASTRLLSSKTRKNFKKKIGTKNFYPQQVNLEELENKFRVDEIDEITKEEVVSKLEDSGQSNLKFLTVKVEDKYPFLNFFLLANIKKAEEQNLFEYTNEKITKNKDISKKTQEIIEKHYYNFGDLDELNQEQKIIKIIDYTKEKLVHIIKDNEDLKKREFSMMHRAKDKINSFIQSNQSLEFLGETRLKTHLNREKVKFNGINSRALQFVDREKIFTLIKFAYAWILADYGIVFCANLKTMLKNIDANVRAEVNDLEQQKKDFLKNKNQTTFAVVNVFDNIWEFAKNMIIKKITTSGLLTFLFGDNTESKHFLNPTISDYVKDYSKSNTNSSWQMKTKKGGKTPFKINIVTNAKGALKNGCISSFFYLMQNYRERFEKNELQNHHMALMLIGNWYTGPLSLGKRTEAIEPTSKYVEEIQTIQRLMIESFDALVLRDAYDYSELFENYYHALVYLKKQCFEKNSDGWGNWLWFKKGKNINLPKDFQLKLQIQLKDDTNNNIIAIIQNEIQKGIEDSLVTQNEKTSVQIKKIEEFPLVFYFVFNIETTNNLVTFHENISEMKANEIKQQKIVFSKPYQMRSIIENVLYENNNVGTEKRVAFFASTFTNYFEWQMNWKFISLPSRLFGLKYSSLLTLVVQAYKAQPVLVGTLGVMYLTYSYLSTDGLYSARKADLMEQTINRENGTNMYMSGGLSRLGTKIISPGKYLLKLLDSSNKGIIVESKKAIYALIAFQSILTLFGESTTTDSPNRKLLGKIYQFNFGTENGWLSSIDGMTAVAYLYFEYSNTWSSKKETKYETNDMLFKYDVAHTFFMRAAQQGFLLTNVLTGANYIFQVLVPVFLSALKFVGKTTVNAPKTAYVIASSIIALDADSEPFKLLERMTNLFKQQSDVVKTQDDRTPIQNNEIAVARAFFRKEPNRVICEDKETYGAQSLLTEWKESWYDRYNEIGYEESRYKPVEFPEFKQVKEIKEELENLALSSNNTQTQKCSNMFTQIYDCLTFKNWDNNQKFTRNLAVCEKQCRQETGLFYFSKSGSSSIDPDKRAQIANNTQTCLAKVTKFKFEDQKEYKEFTKDCERTFPGIQETSSFSSLGEVAGNAMTFLDNELVVLVGTFVAQKTFETIAQHSSLHYYDTIDEVNEELQKKGIIGEDIPEDPLQNLISSEPEIACPEEKNSSNINDIDGIYVRATARSLRKKIKTPGIFPTTEDLKIWDERDYVGWSDHWKKSIKNYCSDDRQIQQKYAEPLDMFPHNEDSNTNKYYVVESPVKKNLEDALNQTFSQNGIEMCQSENELNPSHFILYNKLNSSKSDMYLRAPWRTCDKVVPIQEPNKTQTNSAEQETSPAQKGTSWMF